MVMSFLFWDCHKFRGHLHSWGLHLFEIVFIFFFKTYLFLRLLTCFRLSLGCNKHSLLLQASKRGNQIWKLKLVNSVTTKTEQVKVYPSLFWLFLLDYVQFQKSQTDDALILANSGTTPESSLIPRDNTKFSDSWLCSHDSLSSGCSPSDET